MNRRTIPLVLVLIVAFGVVGAGTAGAVDAGSAGVASTAPGVEDGEAASADDCAGSSPQILVALENGDVIAGTEEVALFTGTSAGLVLCMGEDVTVATDEWAFNATTIDRVEQVGETDEMIEIRTTPGNETGEPIALSDHVEYDGAGEVDAPSLTVVDPVVPMPERFEDSGLRFADDEPRNAFEDALVEYEEAVDELQELETDFEDAVDSEESVEKLDESKFDEYEERVEAVETNSDELEAVLLRDAADGNDDAMEAHDEQRDHREETIESADSSVETYLVAVEYESGDARQLITAVAVVPFWIGIAGGVVVGRFVSRRDLEKVRRLRRRDSSVEYSLTNLWKVLAGAAVAVILGGVVLFGGVVLLGTDPATLFEVIT